MNRGYRCVITFNGGLTGIDFGENVYARGNHRGRDKNRARVNALKKPVDES